MMRNKGTAAIDQPELYDAKGNRMFTCIWGDEVCTYNLTQWARLTGIHRNTIKTRYYARRTPEQCVGLDKITPAVKNPTPRTSIKDREARSSAIAGTFLCRRW